MGPLRAYSLLCGLLGTDLGSVPGPGPEYLVGPYDELRVKYPAPEHVAAFVDFLVKGLIDVLEDDDIIIVSEDLASVASTVLHYYDHVLAFELLHLIHECHSYHLLYVNFRSGDVQQTYSL
jgi:hypothetical protein